MGAWARLSCPCWARRAFFCKCRGVLRDSKGSEALRGVITRVFFFRARSRLTPRLVLYSCVAGGVLPCSCRSSVCWWVRVRAWRA